MTREEAIMVLKNEQPHCGKKALFPEEKRYEAYDMAIKALEQEPREITLEDVKEYCKPRCLTIITDELLYELTHPKIKALEQESCDYCVKRQDVLDILKDKWGMFSDANDAIQESIDTIEALQPVTPLPQPFDLEGLKSDLKALNCGFPYGLDYLLDCLNRRLGITIIEADKAEGSDKE